MPQPCVISALFWPWEIQKTIFGFAEDCLEIIICMVSLCEGLLHASKNFDRRLLLNLAILNFLSFELSNL